MAKFIYADNAATTKLNTVAFEAMKPFLLQDYSNASQLYSFSRRAKKAIKEARELIAQSINAEFDEIYFTSGGTEADNWAIKGSVFSNLEKRAIITSSIEHHAILNPCVSIERLGYPVAYLPVDNVGRIAPEMLRNYVTNNTYLVSIMMVNNEIGTIQPIKELASIAHEYGAMFHTDAVQAIGHIKVDVKDLGIDMLSASAHKFGGPKGVGFFYIKRGTPICAFMEGGAQERQMRAGTENVAGIVGMAKALVESCKVIEKAEELYSKEDFILRELQQAGLVLNIDFKRNGDQNRGHHLPGVLSLSFREQDGEALMHLLDLNGIIVSTGAACDSMNTQISHVLQRIGLDETFAKGTSSISLSHGNTDKEVEEISRVLVKVLVRERNKI